MAKPSDLMLKIDGMHCASCVSSIEREVTGLSGVDECRVNLAVRSASIRFDRDRLDEKTIIDRITGLGFKASKGSPDILAVDGKESKKSLQRFIQAAALAIPLMIVAMWPMFGGGYFHSMTVDALIQAVVSGLLLFVSGREIHADALRQTLSGRANMNSLITMGTMTAWFWSVYALWRSATGHPEPLYFESAAMIIGLILLGKYLEARARGRAGEAIRSLLNLRPTATTAIINGVEVEIEPATAQIGMLLLVKPGERVPADGIIIEGSPVIDESMLTGESVPVDRKPSERVVGGSLNGNRSFKMRVTANGENTYLATMTRMVVEAQAGKAPVQRLADRVAAIFVPAVIGIALVTLVAWLWYAPDSPMLIRSVVSVLIIACPCALGLATPAAILVATGRAAREGIIIKGGEVLETLSRVDTVIFDKTGTLTFGRLEVASIQSFGNVSESELMRMAGSLEAQSEHPVASAVVRHMKTNQAEPTAIKKALAQPGFGMRGEIDGKFLLLGNSQLMEAERVDIRSSQQMSEQEMKKGRTVVYAALEGRLIGLISLADRLRGEAAGLIANLRRDNRRTAMITGDNRLVAAGVAESLGLDRFEAEVRPEQKRLIVESYRKAGYCVAMVGDGINDAPSLAEADVGIAVGGGTDVALETADVVLVRDDLGAVSRMFELAQRALRIIRQNLFWAFFYNVIAIPLAAGAFYPFFGLSLSPVVAAAAMSFSSIFVVSNSLRLNRQTL